MTDTIPIPPKSRMASNHSHRLDIGRRQNLLLADDYVSYTTARNLHWNISEAESCRLHQQFKAQHEKAHEVLRALVE